MKDLSKATKERIIEIRLVLAKLVMLDAPADAIAATKRWAAETEMKAKAEEMPSQDVGVGDAAKVELTKVN